MTVFEATREEFRTKIKDAGLSPEYTEEGGINISLTSIGLSCVYATITKEEIEYYIENN